MDKYCIPAPKADAKPRYVRVTDPAEIAAIQRADLESPIGHEMGGEWFAEAKSLAQYRGVEVEFNV